MLTWPYTHLLINHFQVALSVSLTWPYAHLLINHFPVVLSVSALAVAILALLLGRRGLWLTAITLTF